MIAYLVGESGVLKYWDISQYFNDEVHDSSLKNVVFTKAGLVLYANVALKGEVKSFGNLLYLIDDVGIHKVFLGHSEGMEVSPSGCKLALKHRVKFERVWWSENSKRSLKIINFCKDKSNES